MQSLYFYSCSAVASVVAAAGQDEASCENILKCLFLLILFLIYINVLLYLFKDKIIQEKDKFLHKRTNTGDLD
jgi:ATP/ADP translocase